MRDSQIHWLRKSLMLYLHNSGALAETSSTAFHSGVFDSDVLQTQITSSGMMGMTIAADDFMGYGIRLPKDVDPKFPLGFRVHWTADHDGSDPLTTSWILLQKIIARGAAIAAAASVLDTIIPLLSPYQDTAGDATVVTDFLYQVSGRGILASPGVTRAQIEEGVLFLGKLELDAAANVTTVRLIALEIDYVPWKTQGEGNFIDRPNLHTGVR